MRDKKDGKMTRVDGIGLWRSWKRNFKTKRLALLDLIDNSLDAAIQGQNGNDDDNTFIGRVHVYPDIYESSATTTGLCIVNNSVKTIRPLKTVLEVYNSSKVDSGARNIGENGVGLKQGCATLSDLSFVFVKNGSSANIELGILAQSLQREEGCYLPAFKFSNKKGDGSSPLKDQMILLFSQPDHADVAKCIAQYGAASFGSEPSLVVGVERLCQHFDHICYSDNFSSKFAFLVVLDKVHHGQTAEYVKNAWDAQQKITVSRLMEDLRNEIPRHYLHIPNAFDFLIGGEKAEFKYWPARLVELTAFTVNINSKTSWQQKFDPINGPPDSYYQLRVFVGFDVMRITDAAGGKEGSLYTYSRQSGRLISNNPDARTRLGLGAGGTMFCQGLTVIIDDFGGHLPLNPTKQECAFGEQDHGSTHEENLMATVGSVVHFFYQYHLEKFQNKKTVLTREIAKFGDVLLRKNRQLKTLDSSKLTSYQLSFKSIGKSIRVDKSSVRKTVGVDTLYKLGAKSSRTTNASKSAALKSGSNGRKRKHTSTTETIATPPPKIPRRKQPVSYNEPESESDGEISDGELSDGEIDEANSDGSSPSLKPAAKSRASRKPAAKSRPSKKQPSRRKENDDSETSSEPGSEPENNDTAVGQNSNDDDDDDDPDPITREKYRDLCQQLTAKTERQKSEIKSLKQQIKELQELLSLRGETNE